MSNKDIEQIIIKAMAMGLPEEDDQGYSCLYCHSAEVLARTDIELEGEVCHKKDCPVTLARQLLHDAGTPMNIYKVTGSGCYLITAKGRVWRDFAGYTLAVSAQDAIANINWHIVRDVQATFVREMPLDVRDT